jgi:hypothetical protein
MPFGYAAFNVLASCQRRDNASGNIDNATRQRLVALKNSRDNWTSDELDALNDAIRGSPTQNAFRLIGKLSPEGDASRFCARADYRLRTQLRGRKLGRRARHGRQGVRPTPGPRNDGLASGRIAPIALKNPLGRWGRIAVATTIRAAE